MSEYFDRLCGAMELLAKQPNVIFLGQAVACPGTGMSRTFKNVPPESLLEMPVAEDMQMGVSTGLALQGFLPVSIYPRFNFLLLAINQLVLHLDKLPIYSNGGYKPKVIIRTAVGADKPLYPGAQHVGNYSKVFQQMLHTVEVIQLWDAEKILPAYEWAIKEQRSFLMVEYASKY
jgi:pyruvate/2-oxoglutarate/acetoin dehydrogenase E1 component